MHCDHCISIARTLVLLDEYLYGIDATPILDKLYRILHHANAALAS